MRIAISGYVGKKKTGIGRNLICVLKELIKIDDGNEYILYCNYDNQDLFEPLRERIKIVPIGVSKDSSWGNLFWSTFRLPFLVLKDKADLLFIPNFTFLLLKTIPTVVMIHDMIEFRVKDKFSKLKMLYRKVAVPITARRADFIITVSENSKKDIVEICGIKESKIKVVYNGIDESFKPISKDDAKRIINSISLEVPYILYVGTIDHPGKNSMALIKAYEVLKKEYEIEHKLVLVGMPGKGYETVHDYVDSSQYKNSIVFTGYIEDDILNAIYNCADAFIFPSLYEGFGIPPLEAMACGIPTIVSNTSSLPEVVGNSGIKVNPDDYNSLASEIIKLIKDESYRKRVSKDCLEQSLNFSWKQAGIDTLNVFKLFY